MQTLASLSLPENLQVVRHFWERNDIKGGINALRKLPDHSVGIHWKCLIDFLLFCFLLFRNGCLLHIRAC